MNRTLAFATFLLVATAAWAANPYMPTDAERARWTLDDMLSWRTAIEAYATDYGFYPDAKTLEELRADVQPRYILHAPMHDAWGNPFRYERDEKVGFRFISAGADGTFDPASWTVGGKRTSFDDDAVVTPKERFWFRWWDFQ
jgi:Type II secretion system (T2SS), protein G